VPRVAARAPTVRVDRARTLHGDAPVAEHVLQASPTTTRRAHGELDGIAWSEIDYARGPGAPKAGSRDAARTTRLSGGRRAGAARGRDG
jgi:hypothetical protein